MKRVGRACEGGGAPVSSTVTGGKASPGDLEELIKVHVLKEGVTEKRKIENRGGVNKSRIYLRRRGSLCVLKERAPSYLCHDHLQVGG